MALEIIILAAGKGTRMRSSRAKVMHVLAGKPLLAHVLATSIDLNADKTHVVYGYKGEQLIDHFAKDNNHGLNSAKLNWVEQKQQKGTAHAVSQAIDHVGDSSNVLILYGDVPLISTKTLKQMIDSANQSELALLTIKLKKPGALGRIIRDERNNVVAIREYKDANKKERQINEINTGVIALKASLFKAFLKNINNENVQGEYYLTDIVEIAKNQACTIRTFNVNNEIEITGVNSQLELEALERNYQNELVEQAMINGLTVKDKSRVDFRGDIRFAMDCRVDIDCIFEGDCSFGNNVTIHSHCIIKNSQIGDNVTIYPYTIIEDSRIGDNCTLGPYARLRPGSELEQSAKVGNFVEVKNSSIGQNSKANHLSYIGDANIGSDVNIGAGVITCNYDGANKHKTIIGNNVHVGSDCQLVAPVNIASGATIGAGTTVYKDAPKDELTLNPKKQIIKPGWKRPEKKS